MTIFELRKRMYWLIGVNVAQILLRWWVLHPKSPISSFSGLGRFGLNWAFSDLIGVFCGRGSLNESSSGTEISNQFVFVDFGA